MTVKSLLVLFMTNSVVFLFIIFFFLLHFKMVMVVFVEKNGLQKSTKRKYLLIVT